MVHQHALPADDEETMRREGNVLGRILSPCSTGGPVPARGVPYWSEFVVFHRECREPIARSFSIPTICKCCASVPSRSAFPVVQQGTAVYGPSSTFPVVSAETALPYPLHARIFCTVVVQAPHICCVPKQSPPSTSNSPAAAREGEEAPSGRGGGGR